MLKKKTLIQWKLFFLEEKFLLSFMEWYKIPHFYIIWKILKNPPVVFWKAHCNDSKIGLWFSKCYSKCSFYFRAARTCPKKQPYEFWFWIFPANFWHHYGYKFSPNLGKHIHGYELRKKCVLDPNTPTLRTKHCRAKHNKASHKHKVEWDTPLTERYNTSFWTVP